MPCCVHEPWSQTTCNISHIFCYTWPIQILVSVNHVRNLWGRVRTGSNRPKKSQRMWVPTSAQPHAWDTVAIAIERNERKNDAFLPFCIPHYHNIKAVLPLLPGSSILVWRTNVFQSNSTVAKCSAIAVVVESLLVQLDTTLPLILS